MNLLEFELTHGDEVDRGDDDVPPEALARPLGDGWSFEGILGRHAIYAIGRPLNEN